MLRVTGTLPSKTLELNEANHTRKFLIPNVIQQNL